MYLSAFETKLMSWYAAEDISQLVFLKVCYCEAPLTNGKFDSGCLGYLNIYKVLLSTDLF